MTTHNDGRVSPFGHPRINAQLTAPRGITQSLTSFIGSVCQGIHHVPLHKHTTTTPPDPTKREPDDATGEHDLLTKQKIKMLASTIQFSHNTPPHPHHTQPRVTWFRGDHREQCCPRHPTACQRTPPTTTGTMMFPDNRSCIFCGHPHGTRPPDSLMPAGQHLRPPTSEMPGHRYCGTGLC